MNAGSLPKDPPPYWVKKRGPGGSFLVSGTELGVLTSRSSWAAAGGGSGPQAYVGFSLTFPRCFPGLHGANACATAVSWAPRTCRDTLRVPWASPGLTSEAGRTPAPPSPPLLPQEPVCCGPSTVPVTDETAWPGRPGRAGAAGAGLAGPSLAGGSWFTVAQWHSPEDSPSASFVGSPHSFLQAGLAEPPCGLGLCLSPEQLTGRNRRWQRGQ